MEKKEMCIRIRSEMIRKEITGTDIAKELGTSRGAVSSFLQRLQKNEGINFDTLEKICDILDLEITVQSKFPF